MLPRALLLCLAGCGALTVQVDEPKLCQTLPVVFLPATDGGTAQGEIDLSINLDLPVSQSGVSQLSVKLSEVTVSSGVDGGVLGTLESAKLTVVNPAASDPMLGAVAVDYTRDPAVPAADPLVLAGTQVDLAPYVSEGAVEIQLQLAGEPPTEAWELSVQVCFQVNATIDYADASKQAN